MTARPSRFVMLGIVFILFVFSPPANEARSAGESEPSGDKQPKPSNYKPCYDDAVLSGYRDIVPNKELELVFSGLTKDGRNVPRYAIPFGKECTEDISVTTTNITCQVCSVSMPYKRAAIIVGNGSRPVTGVIRVDLGAKRDDLGERKPRDIKKPIHAAVVSLSFASKGEEGMTLSCRGVFEQNQKLTLEKLCSALDEMGIQLKLLPPQEVKDRPGPGRPKGVPTTT